MVVLLIPLHQLHFGFLHESQPLSTRVLLTVLNLVLTSLSRRLIGPMLATKGGLLNMLASLSLDWRKFQFLLAISAIKVVCGLNVVIRGIRSVDSLSLVCRHSSCVIVRTFSTSRKTLVRWYPHATKKLA